MTSQHEPDTSAFDGLMAETPSGSTAQVERPVMDATATTTEIPSKRAGKLPKPPLDKKRKMLLGGAVMVAAVAGLSFLKKEGAPPAVISPDAAAIIAAAQQASSPPASAFAVADVTPVDSDEMDPTIAALNDDHSGEFWTEGTEEGGTPIPMTSPDAAEMMSAPPVVAVPAPVDVPAPVIVADQGSDAEALRKADLRIVALENDLKRARDAKRAAERSSYGVVVAVLEDGVVVRDTRGTEKVFAVGEQVKR